MTKSILKSVTIGILLGATAFFMPKFLAGLLICTLIFRMLMAGRMRGGRFGEYRFAFADKIRSMSEEEYAVFKNNFSKGHCHYNSKQEITK